MMRFIIVALALASAVGCVHANDVANPRFALQAQDLTGLSAAERAAIPPGGRAEYYPDAVVIRDEKIVTDPGYMEYIREHERTLPDGSTTMPTVVVGTSSRQTDVGAHVLVVNHQVLTCVPGTETCRRQQKNEVVVYRSRPIEDEWRGHGSFLFTHPEGTMLRATSDEMMALIIALEQAWQGQAFPGECRDIRATGRVTYWEHNLLIEAIIQGLRRPDRYVTHHAVERLRTVLTKYQFAINGCYDDEEEEHWLTRGEDVLARFACFRRRAE